MPDCTDIPVAPRVDSLPGSEKRARLYASAACVAWATALVLVSNLSGVPVPDAKVPSLDKILHAVFYGLGAVSVGAFLTTLPRRGPTCSGWLSLAARRKGVVSVAAMLFLGALDEWHQTTVPGRSGADLFDWLADGVGALLGAILLAILLRYVQRRTTGRTSHC